MTVNVERARERWCVRTGWAEEKHRAEVRTAVNAKLDAALSLALDYQMEAGAAAVEDAATALAALEPSDPAYAALSERLEQHRASWADLRKQWITGRWTWSEAVDPMSDLR